MRREKGRPASLACLFLVNSVLWLSNDLQPMVSAATSEGLQDQIGFRPSFYTRSRVPNGAIKMTAREAATIAEEWGLTESWIKEFFDKPDLFIQQYFDIPLCSTNPDCANVANDVLRNRKSDWNKSDDKGKILVFLTYIIGSSIMQERANLKWITV